LRGDNIFDEFILCWRNQNMLSTLEDELNLVVSVFMCFRGFHNYFCM